MTVQTMSNSVAAEPVDRQWLYRQFMPGDAAATRRLVTASAERHAASLELLLSRLRDSGLFPEHDGALTVALERLQPGDGRTEWLASPLVRAWMAKAGQAFGMADTYARLHALLAVLPNISADVTRPGEYELAIGNGVAELADARWRLMVASDAETVRVGFDGNGGVWAEDGSEARLFAAPCLPGTRIALRNDLPSLRLRLRHDQVPERHSAVIGDDAPAGDPFYPDPAQQPFETAAHWLAVAWPEELVDWRLTTRVVLPFTAPPRWTSDGFTVSTMQGAIWCSQTDALKTYESLIHEQSHIKLRYIEEEYPLLAPDQERTTFNVGWRSDPRPLVGVYEGVYVHIHIREGLKRLAETAMLSLNHAAALADRIVFVNRAIGEGAAILRDHARFTDAGRVFLEWAQDQAAAGVNS